MENALLVTSTDRYVVERYLAEGGMGAIYLGKKLGAAGFEKEVVLKQLLPAFTSEPRFIDLFLREARISATLEHANIVQTIDLVSADAEYFIVMEYVRGGDLRTLLKRARRRGKRLSAAAALRVGHSILEALSYAHRLNAADGTPINLIHRDISPSNILISTSGEVKLTDFGIAKASTQQSVVFKVKGKLGYMSPEQARGEPLDQRSDLYSLAVCIYEALVGEKLFVVDLMVTPKLMYLQPVAPPSVKREELPAELDALMLRALSVNREKRFQTADEFQEALTQVVHQHGLRCSANEMATHLREVCGDDANWHKEAEEPVESTAVLDDSGESAPEPRTGGTLSGGTQLTSLGSLRSRRERAAEAKQEKQEKLEQQEKQEKLAAAMPAETPVVAEVAPPVAVAVAPVAAPARKGRREPTEDVAQTKPVEKTRRWEEPEPPTLPGPVRRRESADRDPTIPRPVAQARPSATPATGNRSRSSSSGRARSQPRPAPSPPASSGTRWVVAAVVVLVVAIGVALGVLLTSSDLEPVDDVPTRPAAPR